MGKTRQLVQIKEAVELRPWASERYLRRLIYERRIPFHKLGNGPKSRVLIDLADLDAFVESSRVPTSAA